LSALLAQEEFKAPRLYSKPTNAIIEIIAPQHAGLHAALDDWGKWCRERYQPKTCKSIEGRYEIELGGFESKAPVIALPENPMHRRLDRVVRYMRMFMNQHGEALVLYYVGEKLRLKTGGDQYIRCQPWVICRALHIRGNSFAGFMFYARAAALNILRSQSN
jgi:hypothetical protein